MTSYLSAGLQGSLLGFFFSDEHVIQQLIDIQRIGISGDGDSSGMRGSRRPKGTKVEAKRPSFPKAPDPAWTHPAPPRCVPCKRRQWIDRSFQEAGPGCHDCDVVLLPQMENTGRRKGMLKESSEE